MLDDLRNLSGDILSGKMKDAEIALTKQESAILRLKIEGLIDSNTELRGERATLRSEIETLRGEIGVLRLKENDQAAVIADLTAKLEEGKPVEERLDDPAHEVLKLLFKNSEGLDIRSICAHLNVEHGVASYHVGVLLDAKFIGFTKRALNFAGASTNIFYIHHKGRAYIMKNG
jgi:hypothetical protein